MLSRRVVCGEKMKLFDTAAVFLRRIFRAAALLCWSVFIGIFCVFFTLFCRERTARRCAARLTTVWAKVCLKIMNIDIDVNGDVPETGGLVVSNHTGPFDILVNAAVFPVRFAPKKELKYTPVIGPVVAMTRPVWIDRKRKIESKKTAAEIAKTIQNNVNMLVYPEGTSTDGRHGILPFKSTAFDAAESTGCSIIKVLLFFDCPCDPGKSSAWYDDTPFGKYLWHALGLKKVLSRVYIIGVTKISADENRKTLAKRVHDEMCQEYWRILENEES